MNGNEWTWSDATSAMTFNATSALTCDLFNSFTASQSINTAASHFAYITDPGN